jgi:capsular exopolysaccharide synthesis family protein
MSELTTDTAGAGSGLRRYLTAFRDRWLVIVGIVVVAVAATGTYSLLADKRYKAEADLIVNPLPTDNSTFVGISTPLRDSSLAQPVITAARVVASAPVKLLVAKRLGVAHAPDVSVSPLSQSSIVTLVATATNPARAAQIANAYADAVVDVRRADFQAQLRSAMRVIEARLARLRGAGVATAGDLRAQLAALDAFVGRPEPTLSVLTRATRPESASWPRPLLSIFVAFLASLLVGAGVALALDISNPLVKGRDELLFEHRLPLIGEVPRSRNREIRDFLARRRPLPPHVREAYRTIGRTLEHAGVGDGLPRSILVTSASAGEGKTATAIALAEAISQSGRRVVLVDGDLRKPMITAVFGLPPKRRSISAVLRGSTPVSDALKQRGGLKLLLGAPDPGAIDLVSKEQVKSVVRQLTAEADVVVIDSSPLGEVADSLAFADAVEAVIVCVRLGSTRRDRLADLRQRLAHVGVTPSGTIVIDRRRLTGTGYRYAYVSDRERLLGLGTERGPWRSRLRDWQAAGPSWLSPGSLGVQNGESENGNDARPTEQGSRGDRSTWTR